MPRQPRYAKRRATEAHDAVLAGKSAHKALALALGISPTTLKLWLEQQPDFASAVADARAELARQRAEAAPARAGRKSKYAPGMDETARLHAATGKTDEDIAHELDVSLTTLRNWRQSHPGLRQAIQEGRDCWAVTTVEQSLINLKKSLIESRAFQADGMMPVSSFNFPLNGIPAFLCGGHPLHLLRPASRYECLQCSRSVLNRA